MLFGDPLFGRAKSVRGRVFRLLVWTVTLTGVGILLAGAGAAVGLWAWPPQPSSGFGVALGFIGGAIVIFEMLLWPRKMLRGRRLGAAKAWMRWHIWLGLICLPVIIVHTGFAFGGPLPKLTLILFLAVIVSGIWGLCMQQWLPTKLLADIPAETVASQIDFVGDYHAAEADRLIDGLITVPPDEEEGGSAVPLVAGPAAKELVDFRDKLLLVYLQRGDGSGSPLAARAEAGRRFARLRNAVPLSATKTLDRLEELCDLRRQWDAQARIHWWLHNWLYIHLPLSVAMTGLMIVHAVRALKYW